MIVRLVVVVVTVLALACMSLAANHWLQGQARLPMQWGMDGKPTWYAPRGIALAFIPVLGLIVLAIAAFRKQGVDVNSPTLLVVVAVVFCVVQLIYVSVLVRGLGHPSNPQG